jgi:hypothetical protein
MSRETLARVLGAFVLLVSGWWLAENTEWVDEPTPRTPSGEALTNPVYAFEQLLKRLGMQVEHHESLDTLPPPQARLVLLSDDWAFVPARVARVKQWVQDGGHLVLPDDAATTMLEDWLPAEPELEADSPPPKAAPPASGPQPRSETRTELISSPPLWAEAERIVSCHDALQLQRLALRDGHTATWTLSRGEAVRVMRVAVGRGSVTQLSAGPELFFQKHALRCDMPVLLAGALQAEPGATTWVYLHERRDALLHWLWQRGWIAVVMALLALAAALWRASVRFGPLQAPPPRLRRSITEQVQGLGAWLQRGGTEALLAAQQRALDEAAARALPRYAARPVRDRAAAIAAATGLPAADLASAMLARFCTRAELFSRLHLLETARRRLP